jgi:glycosyltransferase involved in cell wall biosynthesis
VESFAGRGIKVRDRKEQPKRILQIGNWPPPVCGWAMSLVGLRRELEARGWDCPVMNLNENRRVRSPDYIDVQNGVDYLKKVLRHVRRGYAVHVRVNGETKKGFVLALIALGMARLWRRPALLTYCGGHQQAYFPAPRSSGRHLAFSFLFRVPTRIYCNSEAVKRSLLTTGINGDLVAPIPHFSAQYVNFTPAPLPPEIDSFCKKHEAAFFLYICFREHYMLDLLAEAMHRFRAQFPQVGFLFVGTSGRELPPLADYFRRQNLQDSICMTGSVPHDLFLTLMCRSLAYIRIPMTDGVCASVLEALTLKVPVLASDNGTRPAGVEMWQAGNVESLLSLMIAAARDRQSMVARIPEIRAEENTRRLADDIELTCRNSHSISGAELVVADAPQPETVRSRGGSGD